jgi:sugar-specific transcriptional regulator TrmB
MDQPLINQLAHLGLSPTEATIYVAGLSKSVIDVQALVKATSIKRPTIYHALETLSEKGLVGKQTNFGKTKYIMSPPRQLEMLVQKEANQVVRNQLLLQTLVPRLTNLSSSSEQIVTAQYDGIEGIKFVIDTALYAKKRQWDIIAPPSNFLSETSPEYARYYLETRKKRGITSRSLWEKKEGGRKLTPEELKERHPRFLPKVMRGQFQSLIIIFDDKVAIISSLKNASAILITSQEINKTFKTMFEGLWHSSEPYKN